MLSLKKRRGAHGRITQIPIGEISLSPYQSHQRFDPGSIAELAVSIAELGVLKPLSVFKGADGYKLVSGERRLRAAAMAGLAEIPCVVLDVNGEDTGLISLIENLRRGSLDVIGDAEGLAVLVETFGFSQEECAKRLGRSQPAVANRLRLLKLPADVRERMREEGLGERHGRALLRLETPGLQRAALFHILQSAMTVAAAEDYVESLLSSGFAQDSSKAGGDSGACPPLQEHEGQKTIFVMKDMRIFLNTLTRGVEAMRRAGVNASIETQESERGITLTVRILRPHAEEGGTGD